MSLYEKIVAGEEKIALVGLGYVGMPIAVAFAKKINVVGFDLNAAKIDLYRRTDGVGKDRAVDCACQKAGYRDHLVGFHADLPWDGHRNGEAGHGGA